MLLYKTKQSASPNELNNDTKKYFTTVQYSSSTYKQYLGVTKVNNGLRYR